MKDWNPSEYWIEKAREDLASARDNLRAGRLQNAVRDSYFSCFHAFSSLLFKEGKSFKRHKEMRSALHRDYVRPKKLAPQWGKHYDWLFENRQKADYRPLVEFQKDQIEEIVENSERFIAEILSLPSKK